MRGYTGLMAEIYVSDPEHKKRVTVAEVVAAGRARYAADPQRLEAALAKFVQRGKPLETESRGCTQHAAEEMDFLA